MPMRKTYDVEKRGEDNYKVTEGPEVWKPEPSSGNPFESFFDKRFGWWNLVIFAILMAIWLGVGYWLWWNLEYNPNF